MQIRNQIIMQPFADDGGLKVVMLVGNAQDSDSCNQFVEESFVVDGVFKLCVVDMDQLGDKIVGIGHCVFAERAVLVDQVMHAFPVEFAK